MKIGFIGCGNMATSIIKGIIRKQIIDAENIIASAKTKATLDRVQKELGVKVSTDNLEVTENSDILVLAVKPQYYPEVIAQIKDVVRKEQIVISIAPGKTLDWLQEQFGGAATFPIARRGRGVKKGSMPGEPQTIDSLLVQGRRFRKLKRRPCTNTKREPTIGWHAVALCQQACQVW